MLEGQEARVWDQEHWQTPGVVSVQIKKNGEYSVCIRSYSGDWKEPSAPPILFILFYLRLPHWANSTSLVCQWHDFIHEATWEAKPETGNMHLSAKMDPVWGFLGEAALIMGWHLLPPPGPFQILLVGFLAAAPLSLSGLPAVRQLM